MKNILYISAIVLGLVYNVNAQDVHFSNYDQNPLFLNPSLAGDFNGTHRGSVHYRDQWRSITTPYTTMVANYDGKYLQSTGGCMGVGVSFYSDKAGESSLKSTLINGTISYIKKLSSEQTLSVGLQGGYSMKSLDASGLTWDNQFDGSAYNSSLPSEEPIYDNRLGFFDAGCGLTFSQTKQNLRYKQGIALYHINPAKVQFQGEENNLKMKVAIHGNLEKHFKNTNYTVIPSYVFNMKGKAYEVVGGCSFRYQLQEGSKYTGYNQNMSIDIGVHYRYMDALILSALVNYKDYTIKLAYDANASYLSSYSKSFGGFEISLIYIFAGNQGGSSLL